MIEREDELSFLTTTLVVKRVGTATCQLLIDSGARFKKREIQCKNHDRIAFEGDVVGEIIVIPGSSVQIYFNETFHADFRVSKRNQNGNGW